MELKFTAPEALTRWKLQLLAHNKTLATGYAVRELTTQKELLVLPNAPRFLREGDRLDLTAKVSNTSEQALTGTVWLELFDPATDKSVNATYGLPARAEQTFTLAGGASMTPVWRVNVPAGAAGELGYRVLARAGDFTDGEQNRLPVLTNRVQVTDTRPFYLQPGEKKTVTLEGMSTPSPTRTSEVFTFELTSNPTWIGVKALPYLAEYPYDCTEQIANRLFANTLATRIIRSQPRIAEVFEQWRKDSNALKSPLAVNETLKTALLEETPWVREAADESEQQARIATLFDIDRMASEQRSALNKLVERQSGNGSFAWFPGGRPNRYITQYVVETLTRMDELKAFSVADDQATTQLLDRSLTYLEGEMKKEYDDLMELREQNPNGFKPGLSSVILHYLYVRSHWADRIKDRRAADALTFFSQLSETEWVNRGLYEQALMAVTFRNTNRAALATRVLVSLRERALHNEKGMFWKYERSWNWNALPLETHCRLMEAFQLIDPKPDERTALQQWLLLNKQTNRWETTKATAAAVHALLIDADERLTSTERIDVKWSGLDKNAWQPRLETAENSAEAGSGYYQVKFTGREITPGLAEVRLRNKSQVLAWGGLYHTYTEDIDKVNSSVQSPLKLDRQLFRRISTPAGEELENYDDGTTLSPGDRITVRLTVTTDRDMEFVHLKDRRGSGLEPATALSGYRYQDGLGFYFSPTDLAVNYFFDYLPRGTYLLEYDLFVVHRGEYSNGLSVIQSMYAPSFSAHSRGMRLRIGE